METEIKSLTIIETFVPLLEDLVALHIEKGIYEYLLEMRKSYCLIFIIITVFPVTPRILIKETQCFKSCSLVCFQFNFTLPYKILLK